MNKIFNIVRNTLANITIIALFLIPSISQAEVFWVITNGDDSVYLSDIKVNKNNNMFAAYWFHKDKPFRLGEWMLNKEDSKIYIDWGDEIYQKLDMKEGKEYVDEN